MTPRLPDPHRSRAVLVGTHTFDNLDALASVANNLVGLREALTDPELWGLPEGACNVIEQPEDPRQIGRVLGQAAQEATDTLLFYYAGHGLPDIGEGNALHLAVTQSSYQLPHIDALPYEWIRRAMTQIARAAYRIVILDCCHAARAMVGGMGTNTLSGSQLADSATGENMTIIAASGETRRALAPPGETYTAFTGELIELLRHGVPGKAEVLDLFTIHQHLRDTLLAKSRPEPNFRHRGHELIPFVRNRAFQPHPDHSTDSTITNPPYTAPFVDLPSVGVSSRQHEEFRWGPMRSPLMIVEGDGEHVIKKRDLRIVVDHEESMLPPELQEWRKEVEADQEKRREEGRAYYWNGQSYAIDNIAITRRQPDEAPELSLRLKYSDFYTFLATQQLDRQFTDGSTPQQRYIDPYDPLNAPAFMSCSLGTNVAVLTWDKKFIFSRRSNVVGSFPGLWNSSANEALSRDIDSKGRLVPDLFAVAERGLYEELALEPDEFDLNLLALTLDRSRHQWGVLFIARLHSVISDEFLARRSRGVADKWEHTSHELVDCSVESVISFMFHPERRRLWTPTAPALFYLALVNIHGRAAVERDSVAVFRGLPDSNIAFTVGGGTDDG